MPKVKEEYEVIMEVKKPDMYRVILHNDDYTSMEFVVDVLMNIFHKSLTEAEAIMINIHKKGKDICGVYTYEIAYTKSQQVKRLAKQNGFPLLATIEKDN